MLPVLSYAEDEEEEEEEEEDYKLWPAGQRATGCNLVNGPHFSCAGPRPSTLSH